MAKYSIEDTTLTNIANAIREKGQTTETLTPTQMPDAISAIQASSGSEDPYVLRTPEEIYTTERPSNWPILPEPTQDNEFYFLCKTEKSGYGTIPYCGQAITVEWGYIGDDGSFVSIGSTATNSLTYWSETSPNGWVNEKMDVYYVMRTTGGDCSYEKAASGTYNSSKMKWVMEIKARCSNPSFMSIPKSQSYYTNGLWGCQFITLYGPQNWTTPANKFYGMKSLRSLMFKDDNPFAKPNTATSAASMFYNCYSLMTPYFELFQNWTALTNVGSIYSYNYSMEVLDVDLTNNTAMTEMAVIAPYCSNLKHARIIAPNITKGAIGWNSSEGYKLSIGAMVIPKHTMPSSVYNMASNASELLNLKLNTTAMTSSNIAYSGTTSGNNMRRVTMAPDATEDNVPSSWKIGMKHATFEAMWEFVKSLPVTTTTKALTIAHYPTLACGAAQLQIRALAVSKGYTLAFTLE